MKSKLLYISPIENIVKGIRCCYLSEGNSDSVACNGLFVLGPKDQELIQRIIKHGHESTLEHSLITFEIEISRGCLQELSRHRIGVSPSVQSTRYTLKKILEQQVDDIKQFYVSSGNEYIDNCVEEQLIQLKKIHFAADGKIPNDVLKYAIPEALKIKEIISFNWRSFRHFLSLRTNPKAHWEIRELANSMADQIPSELKFLMEDVVHES